MLALDQMLRGDGLYVVRVILASSLLLALGLATSVLVVTSFGEGGATQKPGLSPQEQQRLSAEDLRLTLTATATELDRIIREGGSVDGLPRSNESTARGLPNISVDAAIESGTLLVGDVIDQYLAYAGNAGERRAVLVSRLVSGDHSADIMQPASVLVVEGVTYVVGADQNPLLEPGTRYAVLVQETADGDFVIPGHAYAVSPDGSMTPIAAAPGNAALAGRDVSYLIALEASGAE